MQAGHVKQPLSYLRALVLAYKDGTFVPELAHHMAKTRLLRARASSHTADAPSNSEIALAAIRNVRSMRRAR